ncbi:unnamed protein product, partial [Mesorhabditis belari]|uniref:Cation efflux protein cytoplasmic domain-containing protein n=1 Tax=Mesorhabditis belari TaxID=2138241 RepID=A0AAF3FJ51_9BILA
MNLNNSPTKSSKNQGCLTSLPNKRRFWANKNAHALLIIVIVNLSNILLVSVKGVVAYATGSFSIANSTIESFGDVFVGALILITRIQGNSCFGAPQYPRGRSSESLSNVVASVVMLVLACVNGIISVDNFFGNRFDPRLEKEHLLVISLNILLKLGLYIICILRKDVEQVNVLSKDQRTDVLTNSTALAFALLTRYIDKHFDLLGAVLIFAMIFWNWLPILFTNCNKVHGIQAAGWRKEAVMKVLNEISGITVDDLLVFHTGEKCIVEVTFKTDLSSEIGKMEGIVKKSLEEIEWVRIAYIHQGIQEISSESPMQRDDHEVSSINETDELLE